MTGGGSDATGEGRAGAADDTAGGANAAEDTTDRRAFHADEDDFATMAVHFYRAEVDRMATWRTRLDQTTNWAVVVMAAILTWAFSSPDNPHYVLLFGLLATVAFLVIEAERYQEYDAWRSRVRTLQENVFAPVFDPDVPRRDDWRERLGQDLLTPQVQLPLWQALAHRLHRVYLLLTTVLVAAWVARVTVFETGRSWQASAAVAFVPGPAVVAAVSVVYLLAAGLTVWSIRRAPKREFDEDASTDVPPEMG